MIEIFEEVIHHGIHDTVKMLPFLMAAFLVLETMEHYSGNIIGRSFEKAGKAGPLIGALTGCIPQCGFSVMAANLYAGGIITVGTLIATFIATSDEAILIMMGNPGRVREVFLLLMTKVVIGIAAGYIANNCLCTKITTPKQSGILCGKCGCQEHDAGILKPAIRHTVRIYIYILVFTIGLNLIIEMIGLERVSAFLMRDTIFQPIISAIIGLIPNCASSVVITQMYLNDVISFGAVISGLCTGAGTGLIVLFKTNNNRIENLKIVGIMFVVAAIAGIVLEIIAGL